MKKIHFVCCAILCIGMNWPVQADTPHSPYQSTERQRISALTAVFRKFIGYGNGMDIFNELKWRGLIKQKYPKETLLLVWALYNEKHRPQCTYGRFLKMFELKEK